MGQVQPRVIIWTTLVVLPYMMLHTKFQGHGSTGSGEEDFFIVFTIYGHGSHVGPILPQAFWFQIAQLFLRKTSFNFEI